MVVEGIFSFCQTRAGPATKAGALPTQARQRCKSVAPLAICLRTIRRPHSPFCLAARRTRQFRSNSYRELPAARLASSRHNDALRRHLVAALRVRFGIVGKRWHPILLRSCAPGSMRCGAQCSTFQSKNARLVTVAWPRSTLNASKRYLASVRRGRAAPTEPLLSGTSRFVTFTRRWHS